MKKYALHLIALGLFAACTTARPQQQPDDWVNSSLQQAENQLAYAVTLLPEPDRYPRSTNPDGTIHLVKPTDWTSGFFPGSLWFLYENTRKPQWEQEARRRTDPLEVLQTKTNTHDIGFMMHCSFGTGYRLTNDPRYREINIQGARSLATRYHPVVKSIRSWDWAKERWQFPVIIDNMMNLEMLFWAARETGDRHLYDVAFNHALTTMNHHFRDDASSFHVVDYDTTTGQVRKRETFQGYSDPSSWARGQTWGLYGFTVCYRETKDRRFLDMAEKIAAFYLNHPRMPEDAVPYYDFDAPDIPNEPRDASAAAVAASALLELSEYSTTNRDTYRAAAEKMLRSLSSPQYLAPVGTNNGFVLMHSTGYKTIGSEVDKPLNYADYYYLEAMLRYKQQNQARAAR